MYDFANSAFTTTITTVVFSAYYAKAVVPEGGVQLLGMKLPGVTLWGLAYATSLAIAAALAPIVGAICDFSAAKKKSLTFFWLLGCVSTAALFFVRPGDWVLGTVLYIVGNVAFESSVSLNGAFLPELAPPEKLDIISSVGWGIGYFGGGLCLLANLLMIQNPEWFGADKTFAVRVSLGSVGLWWLLFGLPCILGVRERAVARPLPPGQNLVAAGLGKVLSTLRSMKRFRTLAVLTISVLIFSAGVNTVLAMSGPFAQDRLKFTEDQLIKCFLMIQVVAAAGALLTAWIATRVPTKVSLYVMLGVWLAALVWAFLIRSQGEFWILGAVIGFVMGGTQSLSRGLQAQMTPPTAAGEFFGFYGVTQKLAAATASYIYALTAMIGTKMFGANWGIRIAILSIAIFFIIGLILLYPVDVARGRRESADEEARLQAAKAA